MEEESNKQEVFCGSVIWFQKVGYGFLEWQKDGIKQKDLFIHYSDISSDSGFRMLHKGQSVSFKIGLNYRGQFKAVDVKVLQGELPSARAK